MVTGRGNGISKRYPLPKQPWLSLYGLCRSLYTSITKRGEALSPKGKARSANTGAKDGVEPRHDDLLWKDLLTRFFVPMLQSLLPDLARDIDDKRDVVFLVVEAEATGLRFDISERHGICGL